MAELGTNFVEIKWLSEIEKGALYEVFLDGKPVDYVFPTPGEEYATYRFDGLVEGKAYFISVRTVIGYYASDYTTIMATPQFVMPEGFLVEIVDTVPIESERTPVIPYDIEGYDLVGKKIYMAGISTSRISETPFEGKITDLYISIDNVFHVDDILGSEPGTIGFLNAYLYFTDDSFGVPEGVPPEFAELDISEEVKELGKVSMDQGYWETENWEVHYNGLVEELELVRVTGISYIRVRANIPDGATITTLVVEVDQQSVHSAYTYSGTVHIPKTN